MTKKPTYEELEEKVRELAQAEWARKRAEEALRESETLNRSLVEHLPQRIFIKDRNCVYVWCNPTYCKDLGISPEQIVGKDDFAFHPREVAEGYRLDDRTVMATGTPKEIEEKYRLAGEERWVHTVKVPYYDENMQITGVLGIFEDITARKLTEKALLLSEERFRIAFETSPDAINVNRLQDGGYADFLDLAKCIELRVRFRVHRRTPFPE